MHDQQIHTIMQPPHSVEAEQCVIGGLMLSAKSWWKICDVIEEDDFYRRDHRVLFSTAKGLLEKHVQADVVTMGEKLEGRGQMEEAGGYSYLGNLASDVPSANNIVAYAKIVKEHSMRRSLIAAAGEVSSMAYDCEISVDDLLGSAEKEIMSVGDGQAQTDYVDLKTGLSNCIDGIQERYENGGGLTGLSTGFSKVDELTLGFNAGDLIILAARPSMGKTTLAVNFIEEIAINQCLPSLFFSLEMSQDQIMQRLVASVGRVDYKRVRNGQLEPTDWPRITSALSRSSEGKVYIDDTPSLNMNQIRARARRIKQKHGLSFIVVDYLSIMKLPKEFATDTVKGVGENANQLKALGKELGVPVLVLSQLNRAVETRPNKRPMSSDLRESGAVEQAADIIMMLYRDVVYDQGTQHPDIAELIITKSRNGELGTVCLESDLSRIRFNSSDKEYSELAQETPFTEKQKVKGFSA